MQQSREGMLYMLHGGITVCAINVSYDMAKVCVLSAVCCLLCAVCVGGCIFPAIDVSYDMANVCVLLYVCCVLRPVCRVLCVLWVVGCTNSLPST